MQGSIDTEKTPGRSDQEDQSPRKVGTLPATTMTSALLNTMVLDTRVLSYPD